MQRNQTEARRTKAADFYEVMPLTHGAPYSDNYDEEAPDHDFASLEDEGRAVAVKTLIFVAVATILICAVLIWGVELARQTFQPAASNKLGL